MGKHFVSSNTLLEPQYHFRHLPRPFSGFLFPDLSSWMNLWAENVQWFPHDRPVPSQSTLHLRSPPCNKLPTLPFLLPQSLTSCLAVLGEPKGATVLPTGLPLQALFLLSGITCSHIYGQQTSMYASVPSSGDASSMKPSCSLWLLSSSVLPKACGWISSITSICMKIVNLYNHIRD